MVGPLFRRDGTRGLLQIVLLVTCCWAFSLFEARLRSESLSDVDALVFQGAGASVLILGAVLAATLGRRPRSKLSAIVLRVVPAGLLVYAAVFATTSYADVSVEIEALREASLPQGPGTRVIVGPTGTDIRLSGEITDGAARRLAALLDANPKITRIHLTSEGGLAEEGQAIGDVIAAHHLTTYVPDFCVSACTLAFVRGTQRLILSDSRLGFHAPYQPGLFGQIVQSDASAQRDAYVAAGVAPDFVDAALRIASADIWMPDAKRLIAANVVTDVVDRYKLPDSSLDDAATLAAAREGILRSFAILNGLGPSSRVVDAIAGWYLEAYRAGRSEGETADGLRKIVSAAVTVALVRADDPILAGVAAYVASAMALAPSSNACVSVGAHVDLAAAAAIAPDPVAAALLRAASAPDRVRPRSGVQTVQISQQTAAADVTNILTGAACVEMQQAYAALLARPKTVGSLLRPIIIAEARKAADVLTSMSNPAR